MTVEQFVDLVAEMRANQKFYHIFGEKYFKESMESTLKVDDMLKRLYKGEKLT